MVIVTDWHEIYISWFYDSEKEKRETILQKDNLCNWECIQDNHNVQCIILKTADNIWHTFGDATQEVKRSDLF